MTPDATNPTPQTPTTEPDPLAMAVRHLDDARRGAADSTAAVEYVHHQIEIVHAAVENIRRAVSPEGPLVGAEMKVNTNLSALGHRLRESAERYSPRSGPAAGLVVVLVACLIAGATRAVSSPQRPEPLGFAEPAAAPDHEVKETTVANVKPTPFDMAHAAMRRKDYTAAARHFDDALRSGGDVTLALGGRAECLYYAGDHDDALDCCDRLQAAVPNAARARYVRGLVWLRQGRTDEAHDQFRQAARHGDALAATLLPGYQPPKYVRPAARTGAGPRPTVAGGPGTASAGPAPPTAR